MCRKYMGWEALLYFVEYEIHSEMKLAMSIKELLSASSTKKKLTCMLGEGLLDYFSRDSSVSSTSRVHAVV